MAYRSNAYLSPAARRFMDIMKNLDAGPQIRRGPASASK